MTQHRIGAFDWQLPQSICAPLIFARLEYAVPAIPSTIWASALPSAHKSQMLAELAQFRTLADDWDGYGAARIEPHAIDAARVVVSRLVKSEPQSLTPSTNGTVVLDWEGARGRASLEIGRTTFGFYSAPLSGHPIYLSGNSEELDVGGIEFAIGTISNSFSPAGLADGNIPMGVPRF